VVEAVRRAEAGEGVVKPLVYRGPKESLKLGRPF